MLGQLRSEALDPVATAAAPQVKEKHGAVRMEELARGAGLSLSALEKRFRKMVSASDCFERASKTRPPASEWGRQAK